VPRHVHLLSWFVAASIVLFVATVAVATISQGTHAAARPISELALGTAGGLVTFSLGVVGLGLMALAWALHDAVEVGKGQRRATRLMLAAGFQVLCLALFPTDTTVVPSTPSGWIHFFAASLAFVLLSVTFLLYARLFDRDIRWTRVRRASTAVAWLVVALFLVHLLPVIGPPAAIPFEGILERFLVAALLLWVVISSNHLRRLPQKPASRTGIAARAEAMAIAK
jgi:hypothetical protein